MSSSRPKVVIIADDLDLSRYLSNLLNSCGFIAQVVDPKHGALPARDVTCPALVILDSMLSGDGAHQMYNRLRRHPRLGRVPVLLLSSLTRSSLSRLHVNAYNAASRRLPEPEGVLPTPPEAEHLVAAVRDLCDP